MSFADDLARFTEKLERLPQEVVVQSAVEVHTSIVDGSGLTGAPGQPRDTGYLALSWLLGWDGMPAFELNGLGAERDPAFHGAAAPALPPAPTGPIEAAYIATNAVYAEDQEDNVRGARQLSEVGGHHSVKLTRSGWPRIVDDVVRRLAT